MGNQAGSLKKHIETAEKTGALSFTEQKLDKFPSELTKVVMVAVVIIVVVTNDDKYGLKFEFQRLWGI
jgi:hypothetical protein